MKDYQVRHQTRDFTKQRKSSFPSRPELDRSGTALDHSPLGGLFGRLPISLSPSSLLSRRSSFQQKVTRCFRSLRPAARSLVSPQSRRRPCASTWGRARVQVSLFRFLVNRETETCQPGESHRHRLGYTRAGGYTRFETGTTLKGTTFKLET